MRLLVQRRTVGARQGGSVEMRTRLHGHFGAAWSTLAPKLERWIAVTEGRGRAAVQQVYFHTLAGRVAPDHGHVLSPAEPES